MSAARSDPLLTLAITRRRRDASGIDQGFYRDAEREACVALSVSGTLLGGLRRIDGRGVIMLLATATRAEALRVLEQLPTIAMGVARYTALGVEPLVPLDDRPGSKRSNGGGQ